MELIKKILKEATYENDQKVSMTIKKIIEKIKRLIYNYNGENNEQLEYFHDQKIFFITMPSFNLQVVLFDQNSNHKLAIQANENGSSGIFYNKLNPRQLHLFDCSLNYDQKNSHFINVKFDEETAYHELIHFYDYLRIDQNKKTNDKEFKSNQKKGEFNSDYYNSPLEFNAYFMEKIMPQIDGLIQDNKILKLVKEGGWDKFKNLMVHNPNINVYYVKLNDKYRKKFLKRLAEYYQKITNEIN